MKKSILTCIVVGFLSFCSVVHAQAPIPNGDFEQWSDGEPVGWYVDTLLSPYSFHPITETSDAHGGSSALEGTVLDLTFGGVTYGQFPPFVLSGNISGKDTTGFPYTDHPNSFTGYYKFNPVGGDSLTMSCLFFKNGTGIGEGYFVTKANASSYTSFAVPINWASSDAPDSAKVTMAIFAFYGDNSNKGSTMEVDDLAFSNQSASAVSASGTSSFNLEQNYPNPLTGDATTTIAYSLDEPGFASLVVYDINGRVVATPVHEMVSGGNHIAQIDCSRLPAGVYSYRLTCGDRSATRTMQVLR